MVCTRGFTQVDHFQPGCNVARPKVRPPKETRSTCPLSNVRLSSGCDTVFFWILFINCVALVSGVVQEPSAKLASVTRRLFSFISNTQCRTLCGIGQSFRRFALTLPSPAIPPANRLPRPVSPWSRDRPARGSTAVSRWLGVAFVVSIFWVINLSCTCGAAV